MIVDFQHHYTPRELFKEDPGDKVVLRYDENGAPSYSFHSLLHDLDEHVRMMDESGIDAAVLSCAQGMCGELDVCKFINDKMKEAEKRYPGRFIGTAHAHPLGGKDAFREMERCARDLGYPGIVITSEINGVWLDDPRLDPFWAEAERLGLFVFVHPALNLSYSKQFDAYDMARSIGREFSLVMATVRLINGGVLDRFPNLKVQMAHLSGGIASVLGRIRSYQDKDFWGTRGNECHGALPKHDFDHYIEQRLVFDTAGFCGAISSVKASMVELPAARIVFGTDYPQEIRQRSVVHDFVRELKALGPGGNTILAGNTGLLLGEAERA